MSVSLIRKSKTNEATHIKSSCDMIVLKPIIYFYSNPTRTRGNTMFYTYTKETNDLLHNRHKKRNATCIKHKSYSEDNEINYRNKIISWKEAYELSDVSDFDLD